jgi:dihydrofolate synthase / folylpolyglutamate synthase
LKLEELAAWLFGRSSGGIRWGLERTRDLLAEIGDPQHRFRSVHIGGTNGKGSVAALCAAALRAGSRRRVGLYTSPHLISFTERIQIDGSPIDPEAVLAAAERLRPAIERTGATFFEATTVIAFLCLAEAAADVVVVEVGLGGRLDATNVLLPEAVAITNIELEHTEYLGTSLSSIAAEKAGIIKPGVPVITAERRAELLAILAGAAERCEAPFVTLDAVARAEPADGGLGRKSLWMHSRHWGEHMLEVALAGEFQERNALLAAELLALLPANLRPGWHELSEGFASVRWPGRLQVHRDRGTTFVFDVAHNPAGVAALVRALETMSFPRPLVLVTGVLADKPWETMLPPLLRLADAAILTTPSSAPSSRRWNPALATAILQPESVAPVRVIADLPAALEHAVTLAPDGTVLVTGSIHTVGDAMQHLAVAPFGNILSRPVV